MTIIEGINEFLEDLLINPFHEDSKIQKVSLQVIENIKTQDEEPEDMMYKIMNIAEECMKQGAKPSEFLFALFVCGISIGTQCTLSSTTVTENQDLSPSTTNESNTVPNL